MLPLCPPCRYKKAEGRDFFPEEDPGVISVRKIYNYYKQVRFSASATIPS